MNRIFNTLTGGRVKVKRHKYDRATRTWDQLYAFAGSLGCCIEPCNKTYYIIEMKSGERPLCLSSIDNFDNAYGVEQALITIKESKK